MDREVTVFRLFQVILVLLVVHGGLGKGTNMLFADGHVQFFTNGMNLLLQWTSTDGQASFPFNTDLK